MATKAKKSIPEGFKPAALTPIYRPEGAGPLYCTVESKAEGLFRGKEQTTYKCIVARESFVNGRSIGPDGEVKGEETLAVGETVLIPERAGLRVLREHVGSGRLIFIEPDGKVGNDKGGQTWKWIVAVGPKA